MIKNLTIHKPATCQMSRPVFEVAKLLKDARHVYVLEEQKLAGVISPLDITNAVAQKKDISGFYAKDVMQPADAVEKDQEAEYAMKIMLHRKIFSVPVTEDGALVGVVDYKSVLDNIIMKVEQNGA